jgi:hypothetical protein
LRQIGLTGIGPDGKFAQLAGHQPGLPGPDHAHGDVGLTLQQVAELVGDEQFDLDRRFGAAQRSQHWWQQEVGHRLADAQAHRARQRAAFRAERRPKGLRLFAHAPRRVGDRQPRGRGRYAAARAFEQGRMRNWASRSLMWRLSVDCRAPV